MQDCDLLADLNKKQNLIGAKLAFADMFNMPMSYAFYKTDVGMLTVYMSRQYFLAGVKFNYYPPTKTINCNAGAFTYNAPYVGLALSTISDLDATAHYPTSLLLNHASMETVKVLQDGEDAEPGCIVQELRDLQENVVGRVQTLPI
jgi:hypothetical protein